ncbi:hypothetical protein [Thaumasiovibrio sp. DFM-14]|uniref:hypothetical protein n=1 Tax=Thaumasiovibrio sp. DFM-14 TaxID=3384792 RepID=UPI0039A101EE
MSNFQPHPEHSDSEILTLRDKLYLFHVNAVELDGNRQISFKNLAENGIASESDILPLCNTPIIARVDDEPLALWGSCEEGIVHHLLPLKRVGGELDEQMLSLDSYVPRSLIEVPLDITGAATQARQVELLLPQLSHLAAYIGSLDFDNDSLPEAWLEAFVAKTEQEANFQVYHLQPVWPEQLQAPDLASSAKAAASYQEWHQQHVSNLPLNGFAVSKAAVIYVQFNSGDFFRQNIELIDDAGIRPTQRFEITDSGANNNSAFACFFLHEPAPTGRYRFRVIFEARRNVELIPYIDPEQLKLSESGQYYYEFSEVLSFDLHTSFGPIAVVSGDPVSLEEMLISKYPEELAYLHEAYSGTNTPPAIKSITDPLANTRKLARGAMSYANGFINVNGHVKVDGYFQADGQHSKTDFRGAGIDLGKNLLDAIEAGSDGQAIPSEMKKIIQSVFALHDSADKYGKFMAALENRGKTISVADFSRRVFERHLGPLPSSDHLYQFKVSRRHLAPSLTSEKAYFRATMASRALTIANTALAVDKLRKDISIVNQTEAQLDDSKKALEKAVSSYVRYCILPTERSAGLDDFGGNIELRGNEMVACFEFSFEKNATTTSEGTDKLAAIKAYMTAYPRSRVYIVSHATPINTREHNDALALDRASHIATRLGRSGEDPRVKLDFIGCRGVYVPEAQRRVVTVTLYSGEYGVEVAQSRGLFQLLERHRYACQLGTEALDVQQKQLRMQAFEVLVSTAGFIPAIAPYVAGRALLKEASGLVTGVGSIIDECFLNSRYAIAAQREKKTEHFANVYELERKLIQEFTENFSGYRNDWGRKKFASEAELKAFLLKGADLGQVISDPESIEFRNEYCEFIVRQYYSRAIALSGLMRLIDYFELKNQRDESLFDKRDDIIQGYINHYLCDDQWLDCYDGYSLFGVWLDGHYEAEVRSSSALYQYVKNSQDSRVTYNTPTQRIIAAELLASGDTLDDYINNQLSQRDRRSFRMEGFRSTFPVLSQYTRNQRALSGLSSLIQVDKTDFTARDFDYIGIYFSSYVDEAKTGKENWQEYDTKRHTLTPFDKVMFVLIVKEPKESKRAWAHLDIGYDRYVYFVKDVKGPVFPATMTQQRRLDLPKVVAENSKVKALFDNDNDTQLCVAFQPFYHFGVTHFWGLKPLAGNDTGWIGRGLEEKMTYRLKVSTQGGQFNYKKNCINFAINTSELATDERPNLGIERQGKMFYQRDLLVPQFYLRSTTNSQYPDLFTKNQNHLHRSGQTKLAIFTQVGDGELQDAFGYKLDSRSGVWDQSVRFYFVLTIGNDHYNERLVPDFGKMQLSLEGIEINCELLGKNGKGLPIHVETKLVGELKHSDPNRRSMQFCPVNDSLSTQEMQLITYLEQLNDEELALIGMKGALMQRGMYFGAKRQLYVGCFECQYEAPTGKRVKGLRPLGVDINQATAPLEFEFGAFKLNSSDGASTVIKNRRKGVKPQFKDNPYADDPRARSHTFEERDNYTFTVDAPEDWLSAPWTQQPKYGNSGLYERWQRKPTEHEKIVKEWVKENNSWQYRIPEGEI